MIGIDKNQIYIHREEITAFHNIRKNTIDKVIKYK